LLPEQSRSLLGGNGETGGYEGDGGYDNEPGLALRAFDHAVEIVVVDAMAM